MSGLNANSVKKYWEKIRNITNEKGSVNSGAGHCKIPAQQQAVTLAAIKKDPHDIAVSS